MTARITFLPLVALGLLLSAAPVVEADLVNHWAFDETSGDKAVDAGSGGNIGYIQVAAGVTINQAGKIGTAYDFDGTNNAEVRITGYKAITGRVARTSSIWLKTTHNNDGRGLYSWGGTAAGKYWDVVLDSATGSGTGNVRVNVNGGNLRAATDLRDDGWHLATVTWFNDSSPNITDAHVYVDGAEDTPYTAPNGQNLNTGTNRDLFIGVSRNRGNGNNQEFVGLLDDAALWNEALTADEVKGLYDVGNSVALPAPYHAGSFDLLKIVHDGTQTRARVGNLVWKRETGLTGLPGLSGSGGEFTLVLDSASDTGVVSMMVPEPSSALILTLLGLFALLGRRRRSR